MKANQPRIVFIQGIMPRSGTHFLSNLLTHHPACEKSVIPEDGLLERSAILAKYVNRNYERWMSEGGLPDIPVREMLMKSLGDGLLGFFRRAREAANSEKTPDIEAPKFLVAKSPQVVNIDKFFKLFPHEKLLIIVRDGRALVESIDVSFGYGREEAIRDWAQAAHRINQFEKQNKASEKQYMIVKYEELHSDTEKQMRKILTFLDLDINAYDFESALNIPVVGSSVFKGEASSIHWNPVKKTGAFDPLARTDTWTRNQHKRFNWLAAKELIMFGYTPMYYEQANSGLQLRNRALDTLYNTRLWISRFKKFTGFVSDRMRRHFYTGQQ